MRPRRRRRWLRCRPTRPNCRRRRSALLNEKTELTEANRNLSARLDDLTHKVQAVQNARQDASEVLDGLQGDVLFRTGSAEITPEIAHQIQVLAQAVAKSPELKVRVDGYADPRGSVDANLKLSEDRANAVRDLFLSAGIGGGGARSQCLRQEPECRGRQRRLCTGAPGPG